MDSVTFGIELEFVCVYPQQHELFTPRDDFVQLVAAPIVQRYIKKYRVPVTGQESVGDLYTESPSNWLVKEDTSVDLTAKERDSLPQFYEAEPIEINSPKCYLSNSAVFISQLSNLLTALQAMAEETGCYFLTNKSSGFHVHIGNDTQALPLKTVKRVMQLFLAHERSFDALHTADRITYPKDPSVRTPGYYPSPYFAPLSYFFRKPDHFKTPDVPEPTIDDDGLHEISPLALVARIEQAEEYANLGGWTFVSWQTGYLDGHASTVNFDNMFPDDNRDEDELKNTIEFRQHAGTLDYYQITNYLSLLISAIRFCQLASDGDFVRLILNAADPEFKLLQLMQALGVSEDAARYLSRDKTQGLAFRRLFPSQQPLERLQLANIAECTQNADPAKISEMLDDKERGYYGWDPTAGAVPVTSQQIDALISKARIHATDARTRGVRISNSSESDALIMVYRALHKIYQGLDISLSHAQHEYMCDPVEAELWEQWGIPAW